MSRTIVGAKSDTRIEVLGSAETPRESNGEKATAEVTEKKGAESAHEGKSPNYCRERA